MESPSIRRSRLRQELQHAYDVWMTASEWPRSATVPVDTSGTGTSTRVQWHDYLMAKERLVRAWAEEPRAARS